MASEASRCAKNAGWRYELEGWHNSQALKLGVKLQLSNVCTAFRSALLKVREERVCR
jgi:hypothetical protein